MDKQEASLQIEPRIGRKLLTVVGIATIAILLCSACAPTDFQFPESKQLTDPSYDLKVTTDATVFFDCGQMQPTTKGSIQITYGDTSNSDALSTNVREQTSFGGNILTVKGTIPGKVHVRPNQSISNPKILGYYSTSDTKRETTLFNIDAEFSEQGGKNTARFYGNKCTFSVKIEDKNKIIPLPTQS
jgi:hypothetical protein